MSKFPLIAIGLAVLALGYFALVSDAAAYGGNAGSIQIL